MIFSSDEPLPISVPTKASLSTAKARTANGAVVATTGYSEPGDNGAGQYIYHRNGRSLITVDNNVYVNGPGIDDYFELLTLDECKSSQFGAIGDGLVDDLAALQAADAAATAVGAISVTLTPGVYRISANIVFQNHLNILPGARLLPDNGVQVKTVKGFTANLNQHVFDISNGGTFDIEGARQLSAENFGADPSGTTDSTNELNAFLTAAYSHDCGTAYCNGSYITTGTLNIGPARDKIAVTFDSTTDTFTSAAHGLPLNYKVSLTWSALPLTIPSAFSSDVEYYLVNVTTDTFQLSLTPSGSPVLQGTAENGSNIAVTTGRSRTKNYQGAMIVYCQGTFDVGMFFRYNFYVNWKGLVRIFGSETLHEPSYAVRTVTHGVVHNGVNHCYFDGFYTVGFKGHGLFLDGLGIFNYDNTIIDAFSIDCGSCGADDVDGFTVLGTWGTRVDIGSSGSYDQRSTITLSTLPPVSTDGMSMTMLINGRYYDVVDFIRGASTVQLYPWLPFQSLSFDFTTDTFTAIDPNGSAMAHGFALNTVLRLTGTLPPEFSTGVSYYVVNPTTNTFQLSATPSGAAITAADSNGLGINAVLFSGSYKFIFGSGVHIRGSEAAGNTIVHISAIRTGNGLASESLYGPTIGVLQTQVTGVGCSIGLNFEAAMYGLHVARFYGESLNKEHFLLKTGAAYSVNISSFAPAELHKVKTCHAPLLSNLNVPSPSFDGLHGCSLGTPRGLITPSKPINNSERLTGSATLDIGINVDVSYRSDTFTLVLRLWGDTELEKLALIKNLGQDSFKFTMFGTSSTRAPTGTLTVYPPTGWSINGGVADATAVFSGFVAPTTFYGYMDVATKNIHLDPQLNAALERDNHLGTQKSITVDDFGISVQELVKRTTFTELLRTANSLLIGDANEDGSGDADDSSGNHDGTWVGTPAYASAPQYKGKSFVFSGSNAITQPSAAGNLTNNFTVACWVRQAVRTFSQRIVSKRAAPPDHAWELYIDSAGSFAYNDGGGYVGPADAIKVGRWHHVAFVANGANSQLYVDGAAYGSTFNILIVANSELVNWGRIPLGPDSFFIGKLYLCGIWNSVLSAGDIALLYDRTQADVLQDESATTAQLESLTSDANTFNKFEGKSLFNTVTNKPVWALGSAAGDVWVDSTGATVHTPI